MTSTGSKWPWPAAYDLDLLSLPCRHSPVLAASGRSPGGSQYRNCWSHDPVKHKQTTLILVNNTNENNYASIYVYLWYRMVLTKITISYDHNVYLRNNLLNSVVYCTYTTQFGVPIWRNFISTWVPKQSWQLILSHPKQGHNMQAYTNTCKKWMKKSKFKRIIFGILALITWMGILPPTGI